MIHYDDVIMTMLASQITSLTVVYSIVYSGVNQRKHQSSASLAFVREIHRGPVNFPHKWPVTRKMFPFDDVIMLCDEITDPLPNLQRYNREWISNFIAYFTGYVITYPCWVSHFLVTTLRRCGAAVNSRVEMPEILPLLSNLSKTEYESVRSKQRDAERTEWNRCLIIDDVILNRMYLDYAVALVF